jgi:integrase
MASVSFVRGRWRALVRVKPYRGVSKSFDKEPDAWAWGRRVEAELKAKTMIQPDRAKLRPLIERYIEEHPLIGRSKLATLQAIAAGELGSETLVKLTPERLVKFGRSRGVAGQTLVNDLSALSTVLKHAKAIWKVSLVNPVPDARYALRVAGLLDPAQERDRRPTADELDAIKGWVAQSRSKLPMADLVDFAVATAMRAGEITSLRWSDYDEKAGTILVRERKHPTKKRSNDQVVPLLKSAVAVLARRPRTGDRIFPVARNAISCAFPKVCQALGIVDLHFHDLRHDGISRLFEMGYQIQEVAMFSGHADWKQLKRYTQIRPESLRRLG